MLPYPTNYTVQTKWWGLNIAACCDISFHSFTKEHPTWQRSQRSPDSMLRSQDHWLFFWLGIQGTLLWSWTSFDISSSTLSLLFLLKTRTIVKFMGTSAVCIKIIVRPVFLLCSRKVPVLGQVRKMSRGAARRRLVSGAWRGARRWCIFVPQRIIIGPIGRGVIVRKSIMISHLHRLEFILSFSTNIVRAEVEG